MERLDTLAKSIASTGFFSKDQVTVALAQARAVGLTTEMLERLSPTLAALAVVWGKDFTTALEAVRKALFANNAELAESIGLNLHAKAVADFLGVTVGELTSQYTVAEIQQAKLNLILTQGTYALSAVEEASNTASGSVAQMNAALNDLQVSIGDTIGPVIGKFADLVRDIVRALNSMPSVVKQATIGVALFATALASVAGPVFFLSAALPGLARAIGVVLVAVSGTNASMNMYAINQNLASIATKILTQGMTQEAAVASVLKYAHDSLGRTYITEADVKTVLSQATTDLTLKMTAEAAAAQNASLTQKGFAASIAGSVTSILGWVSIIGGALLLLYMFKDEIRALTLQVAELSGALKIDRTEVQMYTDAADALTTVLNDLNEARQAESEALNAVKEAQEALNTLSDKMRAAYESIIKLQDKYNTLIGQIADKEKKLLDIRSKLLDLLDEQRYAENQLAIARLVSGENSVEAVIAENNLRIASEDVTDALEDEAETSSDLTDLKEQLAAVEAQIKAYNELITDLTENHPELLTILQDLITQWQTENDAVTTLATGLEDYKTALETYQTAIEDHALTLVELHDAEEAVATVVGDLIAKYPELSDVLGDYSTAAGVATETTAELNKALAELAKLKQEATETIIDAEENYIDTITGNINPNEVTNFVPTAEQITQDPLGMLWKWLQEQTQYTLGAINPVIPGAINPVIPPNLQPWNTGLPIPGNTTQNTGTTTTTTNNITVNAPGTTDPDALAITIANKIRYLEVM